MARGRSRGCPQGAAAEVRRSSGRGVEAELQLPSLAPTFPPSFCAFFPPCSTPEGETKWRDLSCCWAPPSRGWPQDTSHSFRVPAPGWAGPGAPSGDKVAAAGEGNC